MGPPLASQTAKIVEANRDGALALIHGRVQIHAQTCDSGALDRVLDPHGQCREPLLGSAELAREELAFGPIQLEREDEFVPSLPTILRQQDRTGGEISDRRGVGGRSLGAFASKQIQLSQLLALAQ